MQKLWITHWVCEYLTWSFTFHLFRLWQKLFKKNEKDLDNRRVHTDFAMEISTNFDWYYEKVFVHMNTWMVGINLMKYYLMKQIITNAYYKHVKEVWNYFESKSSDD